MRIRNLAAVSLLALGAAGCTTSNGGPAPETVLAASDAQQRADVNPGYKAGSSDIPSKPTASLNELISKTGIAKKKEKPKEGEDRLRLPAMQEAATAYGARGGLAFATREINRKLEGNSAQLARTYDFQMLMIQGPTGVMVNPPVIVEATDAWESFDAGKTLRVADTVYEIVEQARFSSVAPMWQSYLISNFEEPVAPPNALLPQDEAEKGQWAKWVADGWKKGEEQAGETFQSNLDRLNRDYTGMVRYKTLLEEGKVSAPILAEGNLGNTGSGQDMRVNDRAIRITQDPSLQINPTDWSASATVQGPDGKPKGAETPPPPPPAAKPQGRKQGSAWKDKPRHAPKPTSKPVEKVLPKTVDEATSGGSGRF